MPHKKKKKMLFMGECQCLTTFSTSSVLLLFVVLYWNFWANKDEWMNEWKFNIETCAWVSLGDYLKRLCFAETRRIETFCLSAPCTSTLTYLLKTRHSSQLLVFLYSVINKYCRNWRRETVSYCVVIVWLEWVIGVLKRWSRRKTASLAE